MNTRNDKAKDETIAAILKKKGRLTSGVKKDIESARKPKMRTVEHFLCDRCQDLIAHPRQGFIVQGNIYVADPSCRGGLIGRAFPDPDQNNRIPVDEIQETVLCLHCFCDALGVVLDRQATSRLIELEISDRQRVHGKGTNASGDAAFLVGAGDPEDPFSPF